MNSKQVIFEFVLSRLEADPIARQIELLKSLADYAGDKGDVAALLSMAEGLEAVRREGSQLRLKLQFGKAGRAL